MDEGKEGASMAPSASPVAPFISLMFHIAVPNHATPYGNVTEEHFVLILLFRSLVPWCVVLQSKG